MTNEEKSMEIADLYCFDYCLLENDGGTYDVDSKKECFQSAMNMAEWKDKQLYLLIDAIDYVYLQTDGSYTFLSPLVVDKIRFLKNQISKK